MNKPVQYLKDHWFLILPLWAAIGFLADAKLAIAEQASIQEQQVQQQQEIVEIGTRQEDEAKAAATARKETMDQLEEIRRLLFEMAQNR